MNHLSIAIVRKSNFARDEQFNYLIISENDTFKFFDYTDNAFGARFDLSALKRRVLKYFDLPDETGDGRTCKFQKNPSPFKFSKRNPEATAYLFELSECQVDAVDRGIKSADGKWKNIQWINENEWNQYQNRWKVDQQFLFGKEPTFKNPGFSNEFRASLRNIVNAKENGKLVVFAGAGVSYDSNVPGWDKLIEELKNDLSTDENEYLKVGELYYQSRGNKEYQEKIQQVLGFGKTKYNPLHKKILDLKPIHIITTNYDTHFEQIIEATGEHYSIITRDSDLPYSKDSSLYVKMHGDFGSRNVVLSASDYGRYSKTFPLIESIVKEVFASKLVLFVGFSFSDPNLQAILDTVKNILGDDNQQPYLLLSKSSDAEKQKDDLQKKGIKGIEYDPATELYFDQVKIDDDTRAMSQLSQRGDETYKLLRVIEEFDLISDTLENLEVESQLIHSIQRFKELGAIPIDILCASAPFKLKGRPRNESSTKASYDYYNPNHLDTLNEDLLEFLNGKKNANGVIEFLAYKEKKLSQRQQELNHSFRLLYMSGIHCIIRKNDTQVTHNKLIFKNRIPHCECMRCLDDRFELKRLLHELNSFTARSLCKDSLVEPALTEAYGYMKTGQVVKCFYMLEDVKIRSIKSHAFITNFLAVYNQKQLLRYFDSHFEKNVKKEEVDEIIQKIEKIDLHELISSLRIDRETYRCLVYILENKILEKNSGQVYALYNDVLENYKKHLDNSFRTSGPAYWYILNASFDIIYYFYHQNFLFNDETPEFYRLSEKYVEAMIASFGTSERYEQRMHTMPELFFKVAINYSRPSDLNKWMKEYRIVNLKEGEVGRAVADFLNFLDSYQINRFMEETVSKDIQYSSTIESSSYFRSRIVRLINNFLVILRHTVIDAQQLNKAVNSLINYLSVSDLFPGVDSLKYFSSFIEQHVGALDASNTLKVSRYILSDNIWPSPLIQPYCNALLKRGLNDLFEEEFYEKMIQRASKRRNWPLHIVDTIPFFQFLASDQKQKHKSAITSLLIPSNQLRWTILKKAYDWKMMNPDRDEPIFKHLIEDLNKKASSFPSYVINSEGQIMGDHFQPWNDLYFAIRITHQLNWFESEGIKSLQENLVDPMLKWILRPVTFDYDQFRSEWLIVFNKPEIIKNLKAIKQIHESVHSQLSVCYNEKVARIYYTQYHSSE